MKKQNKRCIYVLYGPTGVGKTDCADLIGRSVPVEIINMDVGQLYESFSIGTAKPSWRSSDIPHHMFDIMAKAEDFSCAAYRSQVERLVEEIWQRGATPLFVGGSGFYLRSLFFPPDSTQKTVLPTPLPYGPDVDLWEALFTIDPARALKIPRKDLYRITRALTLWHATGIKPSQNAPLYKPIAPALLFFCTRDRAELYERINERVDQMLDAGWLKEILPIMATAWQSFILRKKLIGYDDLVTYLLSDQTPTQWHNTITLIKKRTRNYAKRQETYGRMLERELIDASRTHQWRIDIQRLNLTSMDIDLYIKRLFTHVQIAIGKTEEIYGE